MGYGSRVARRNSTSCAGIRWHEATYQEVALMLDFSPHSQVTRNVQLKALSPVQPFKGFLAAVCSCTLMTIVLIMISFIFCTHTAHAVTVTLAWDPNAPNENVTGYKLYIGTESKLYTTVIDVSDKTLKSVTKLKKGHIYFFAATAYDNQGEESDFSEELVVNTCTYKISPSKKSMKAIGGIGKAKVATQPNCYWTADSGASWLTLIEGESGKGNGHITYSVDPNPDPEPRSTGSSFAGKAFTLTQQGTGILD